MSKVEPQRFEIKLSPFLKDELKRKALTRGVNLSAYIQDLLWHHCPEAEQRLDTHE